MAITYPKGHTKLTAVHCAPAECLYILHTRRGFDIMHLPIGAGMPTAHGRAKTQKGAANHITRCVTQFRKKGK